MNACTRCLHAFRILCLPQTRLSPNFFISLPTFPFPIPSIARPIPISFFRISVSSRGSSDSVSVSKMGSDTISSLEEDASGGRTSPGKKNPAKIPKRIHKAEREKQNREHLNELFQDLADALELTQPNNGKASILSDASRLLKEISGQIESLKKENVSLLSESRYVTTEKNELIEEYFALESQIGKLKDELRARVVGGKPDLNIPPPLEYPQHPQHPGEEDSMQQPPAFLIVPIHPEHAPVYPMQATQVSKPHARYPRATDSWPSQLLIRDHVDSRLELQLASSSDDLTACNQDRVSA